MSSKKNHLNSQDKLLEVEEIDKKLQDTKITDVNRREILIKNLKGITTDEQKNKICELVIKYPMVLYGSTIEVNDIIEHFTNEHFNKLHTLNPTVQKDILRNKDENFIKKYIEKIGQDKLVSIINCVEKNDKKTKLNIMNAVNVNLSEKNINSFFKTLSVDNKIFAWSNTDVKQKLSISTKLDFLAKIKNNTEHEGIKHDLETSIQEDEQRKELEDKMKHDADRIDLSCASSILRMQEENTTSIECYLFAFSASLSNYVFVSDKVIQELENLQKKEGITEKEITQVKDLIKKFQEEKQKINDNNKVSQEITKVLNEKVDTIFKCISDKKEENEMILRGITMKVADNCRINGISLKYDIPINEQGQQYKHSEYVKMHAANRWSIGRIVRRIGVDEIKSHPLTFADIYIYIDVSNVSKVKKEIQKRIKMEDKIKEYVEKKYPNESQELRNTIIKAAFCSMSKKGNWNVNETLSDQIRLIISGESSFKDVVKEKFKEAKVRDVITQYVSEKYKDESQTLRDNVVAQTLVEVKNNDMLSKIDNKKKFGENLISQLNSGNHFLNSTIKEKFVKNRKAEISKDPQTNELYNNIEKILAENMTQGQSKKESLVEVLEKYIVKSAQAGVTQDSFDTKTSTVQQDFNPTANKFDYNKTQSSEESTSVDLRNLKDLYEDLKKMSVVSNEVTQEPNLPNNKPKQQPTQERNQS